MIEKLKEYSIQIGKALSQSVDSNNPAEILGKIEELSTLLALSAHAVALSEKVYNERICELVGEYENSHLSATEKKLIFQGRAKEEIYYLTLSERQNKALVHKIDGLRSVLSYLKTELEKLQS